MVDRIKLVLAVLVLAAGIGGYYYLGDKALVIRVLVILAALLVAAGIVLTTATGRRVREFMREAMVEMRKVVWPTRKETVQMTTVVVVMVIVAALFLWFIDWALLAAVKSLTGQGA